MLPTVMKNTLVQSILGVCLAALLTACQPSPTDDAPAVSVDQLAVVFGPANLADLQAAIAAARDKNDIIRQLCIAEYRREIEILASFSMKELNRRLDSVRRGTSRSGYTELQLLTAIQMKQSRAVNKPVNK